ncbi:MAG: hypothetical protein ACPGQL_11225 [Thermoplasmatota archaeon]
MVFRALLVAAMLVTLGAAALPGASAAPENPQCNTFWYATFGVGPVEVGTNLQPDCTTVDVYIPEYQACLWKGSWKPLVSAGPVTVWHYTCDNPHS